MEVMSIRFFILFRAGIYFLAFGAAGMTRLRFVGQGRVWTLVLDCTHIEKQSLLLLYIYFAGLSARHAACNVYIYTV